MNGSGIVWPFAVHRTRIPQVILLPDLIFIWAARVPLLSCTYIPCLVIIFDSITCLRNGRKFYICTMEICGRGSNQPRWKGKDMNEWKTKSKHNYMLEGTIKTGNLGNDFNKYTYKPPLFIYESIQILPKTSKWRTPFCEWWLFFCS